MGQSYVEEKEPLPRENVLGLDERHIRNVQENITERRDDKVVVVREGTLVQVETDSTSVTDDHAGLVGALLVDDNGLDSRLDDSGEDVLGVVKGNTGHAVRLGCAAIHLAEVELLAKLADLVGDTKTRAVVELLLGGPGVVDESLAVPVQVATGKDEGGLGVFGGLAGRVGHAVGVLDTVVLAVGGVEAGHGDPAEGLAVAAGLDTDGGLVVDDEVADVAVATKDLNGGLGVLGTDGVPDKLESA